MSSLLSHNNNANKDPDLQIFKVFGCLVYASTLSSHKSIFDSRARKYVFLGYNTSNKRYLLLDLRTNEVFIYRNIIFHEHIIPYSQTNISPNTNWEIYIYPTKPSSNDQHTSPPTTHINDKSSPYNNHSQHQPPPNITNSHQHDDDTGLTNTKMINTPN